MLSKPELTIRSKRSKKDQVNLKSTFFCFLALVLLQSVSGLEVGYAQEQRTFTPEDPSKILPQELEIQEIRVEGLITARETYVTSISGLQVGTRVSIPGEQISEAIRKLYQTGLFSDVQIRHERVAGGVAVTIIVEEQPRLQEYELRGGKRSQRNEIRDELNLLSGYSVTKSMTEQAVRTIRRYFRGEGYWGTTVEVRQEVTDEERSRVKLIFDIDPGEQHKVRQFLFEGNDTFSDRTLRKAFETIKEDRWWKIFKKHVYIKEDFEEGKANLLSFYRDRGFRDARIVADSVYVDRWKGDEDAVYFAFTLQEGPQYKVRNIIWDGNTVYTDEQLTEALGFEKGDVFNETKFSQNLSYNGEDTDINSLYQNIGYLFFNVFEQITIVNGDSLDLSFEIFEDEIATIRAVRFSGNSKTHDDVVRRNLRTIPGQTYSQSAIIRSIRELAQLGYFNPEGITPDIVPNRVDRTVDIAYQLEESQGSDNFELSGGFGGRQIGVILAARVNFNNFSAQRIFEPGGWDPIPSGDGQKLSLGAQITGRGYQSFNFSFVEPWFRGRPTSLGVSLSYDFINYSNSGIFGFQSAGISNGQRNELFSASLSLGRRLKWPDDFFSQRTILTYNLFNVRGFDEVFEDGQANILSLKQVIERNSTDNPISPRAGSKFNVSAEVALPMPGFAQFYKIQTAYQQHATVAGKLVLSSTAEYGYMGYFGKDNRSNFKRYFLGGTPLQQRQNFLNDNIDLRGFPGGFNGVISPLDENRNLVGGRVYSKYSFEVRYPAVSSEQIQLIPYLFFDAGNAFNDLSEFDPFNIKRATGLGARIFLPILGLVDLSYGYRFDGTPASNEGAGLKAGEWEFLFNIGAPF